MKCRKCETELAEGVEVCPECGERVAETPPPAPQPDLAVIGELHKTTKLLAEKLGGLDEKIDSRVLATSGVLIERVDQLETRMSELKLEASRPPLTDGGVRAPAMDLDRTGGFESLGDFLVTILTNRAEPRLVAWQQRVMSMGVGTAGGFLVPQQFAGMLAAIEPSEAVVRPRATVIPAGTPPDSAITMPVLNQSGAAGVHAGVTVTWIGEGVTKPVTEPAFLELTLTPHEVAAHVVLTDKLIRNAPSAAVIVEKLLRGAIIDAEDTAFIAGTGVGQPLGFLGHASSINVARFGPAGIVYADVVAMYSQILRGGGPLVWIANPTTLPQLQAMASALGQLIWQPSARESEPSNLLGIPLLISERQPVLGANGDLMLVNLSYYLIKDGSPLTVADDAGLSGDNFKYNKTSIKAFWNVDGHPWLTTPLLLEDGVTQASPFVVLL